MKTKTADARAGPFHGLVITPMPVKTMPDWTRVARLFEAGETVLLPTDINANSGIHSLLRYGLSVYPVKIAGALVAYSVEPIRHRRETNEA